MTEEAGLCGPAAISIYELAVRVVVPLPADLVLRMWEIQREGAGWKNALASE
ncbi:MAG: hypothetical protein LCH78_17995 [Proteobacteria bacterium]|nr:hypothetical protein [Pseudomonadota bacterium]